MTTIKIIYCVHYMPYWCGVSAVDCLARELESSRPPPPHAACPPPISCGDRDRQFPAPLCSSLSFPDQTLFASTHASRLGLRLSAEHDCLSVEDRYGGLRAARIFRQIKCALSLSRAFRAMIPDEEPLPLHPPPRASAVLAQHACSA